MASAKASTSAPTQRTRGSGIIVVVLLVSLILSAVVRNAPRWFAGDARPKTQQLSRLDSFTLGLLLGGLRGPLVMMLWSASESQRNDRELQNVDTQIELIRLLQPEFDAVHLFQIWNKGYNIARQMASLPNKYVAILDAVDYGWSVDQQRPDNINIQTAIADLMFNQLGEGDYKLYYRRRVRSESLPPEPSMRVTFSREQRDALLDAARRAGVDPQGLIIRQADNDQFSTVMLKSDAMRIDERLGEGVTFTELQPLAEKAGGRRLRFRQLLNADGRLLENLRAPVISRAPSDSPLQDDGSPYYWLEKFEPYPYGVSPFALAYHYYKRAQFLQEVGKQTHTQFSPRVIHSRPAVTLRYWAEEELVTGRLIEASLLSVPLPEFEFELEMATADLAPDAVVPSSRLAEETIYHYHRAASLVRDHALQEYALHIKRYPQDLSVYQQHLEWLPQIALLAEADAAYLQAVLAEPSQKEALLTQAADSYRAFLELRIRFALRYWARPEVAADVFPAGVTRDDVDQVPTSQLLDLLSVVESRNLADHPSIQTPELKEFKPYVDRAVTRLALIGKFLGRDVGLGR